MTKQNLLLRDIAVLDVLPFGIMVVDANGKILFQNRTAVSWGSVTEQIAGQIDWGKVIEEDMEIIEKSNFGDKWFQLYAIPVGVSDELAVDEKSLGVLVIEDVTQHQMVVKELEDYRTSFQDLQTIFDTSFDVIYVSDGNGVTLRVSSACERLWGLKKEELIGRSVFELEAEGVFR